MDDSTPAAGREHGRFARPTLEQVERLRGELLVLSLIILCLVVIALVGLSFASDVRFSVLGEAKDVIRVSLIVLAGAFAAYVFAKERRLRSLTKALINERVVTSALMNQMRQLSLLAEAGRAVTSTGDLDQTLRVVLASAVDLLEADEGSVLLQEGSDLTVVAAVGPTDRFLGRRQPMTEGVAGYVARTGQPLLIQGELDIADLFHLIGDHTDRDTQVLSSISVPLVANEQTLGVMSINVKSGSRRYAEYDRQTLELFAHHAAIAVCQARLLQGTGQSTIAQAAEIDEMRSDLVGRVIGGVASEDAYEITTSDPQTRRGGRPAVLVSDDDPALLRFLQIALETEGFDVSLASDGQTTLDRLKREEPDVLLLDIALPVIDGWGVLEALRTRPRRPRVVCISARKDRRDRVRAWMLGVHEYVPKPFDVTTITKTVRSVLDRSPEQQAERRDEALRELFAAG